MEPFDLTFHEVTSDDSDASNFDSFSNVVNYETSFHDTSHSLPLNAYNINTVQYLWKDYTSPATTAIQASNGGIPTGDQTNSTVQHQPVWSDPIHGSPPHRAFLVHPDDSLAYPQLSSLDSSPTQVTKTELQVLAQISANTAAITRQGKRSQRFVARTITSPSTPIPYVPFTMSHQADAPPGSATGGRSPDYESDGQGVEDNSFETVAEALRLQWSVIGNKSVAPVSAEVVAQIVAEAERKLKGGDSNTISVALKGTASPMPLVAEAKPPTPATSPTQPGGELSPSLETNSADNATKIGPGVFQEAHRGDCPRELIRIIPSEITKEKPQSGSSRLVSGAKSPKSTGNRSNSKPSPASQIGRSVSPLLTSASALSYSEASVASPQSDSHPSQANTGSAFMVTHARTSSAFTSVISDLSGKHDVSDTFSEASYSSEIEMDKYLQQPLIAVGIASNYKLESEEFLKSLPPIKPINLDAYASFPLLPPRPAKVQENMPKAAHATKAKLAQDIKSRPDSSVDGTPKNRGEKVPESPIFSSPVSPSSAYGSLTDTFSPDSKTSTPSQQFSPLSPGQSSTFSTPNQNSLYHLALSGRDSSSAMADRSKKQFDELLKEKAKLQGQLEVLTEESQIMLKERTELQAQLATLKARLASLQVADGETGDSHLRKEVEKLRASRQLLERTILDANRMLSEKAEEVRALHDELQVAQDMSNKLQVRSQEMRDDIRAKDMNVQALKNKIAELYVEVQTSIQAKMEAETESRTSKNDLVSLVKAKEWYQEQLQLAHDVRAKLQRELTILKGETVSHGTIVERLKSESTKLRQQLSETQQRALRDKEQLARHLEGIQVDMMERETAFLEIQRERKLFEDTFNYQVTSSEEEKKRLAMLQQATHDLEAQLDRAHKEAKKRHEQLVSMEMGQMDVMKRLAVSEETLTEKERALEEMEQKLIQMEFQMQAVMSDLSKKDMEILSLKEEKATTEIALKSALQEKESVDKALEILKADMGKVEMSFKQMKHELNQRLSELQLVKSEKEKMQEELDRSQHELEIKSLSVDAMTRTFDGQSVTQQGLEAEKAKLEDELYGLRLKVQNLEYELKQKEQVILEESNRVNNLNMKISEMEAKLEEAKDSVPADKIQIYENEIKDLHLRIRALEEVETDEATLLEKEKEKMQSEIARLKKELLERQKAYDENLIVLDNKLKELTNDRQQLETELGIARQSEQLSQLEERDSVMEEIQSLTNDLKAERQEKLGLEQRLLSIQANKATEIDALQHKLQIQTETLQILQSQQALVAETEATNQILELELEKERGRVLGLTQKNTELKEHAHQLEAALAQRESAWEDLKRTVEESTRDLEQRDQKFLDRIAGLETSVEKEVEVQRDLRKQMGTKIMENKRLKKLSDSAKLELEQLKQDLTASQQAANQAMADLEAANQLSQSQLSEARESSAHAKALETELDRVGRELNDNLARQPMLMEQIQSLEWQCAQKSREVQAAHEQMRIVEDRALGEIEAVKLALQVKQTEIDSLQAELTSLRQEKTLQRSQVNELRGALKASVQHHKLTKRLNENDTTDKGVQANIEKHIVLPPLPFDLAVVEQLIQDTRVTPLDSKPLDQLSSCLSSLRAEISGLQKQMDHHTAAVHNSSLSWRTVQTEVDSLNEVMKTIASTIIAANSTRTVTMTTAVDRERADILHV